MSNILELTELEDLFVPEDQDEFGIPGGWPDSLILLSLGGGKYAGVGATTTGPDPMEVMLIAVFPSEKEAELYEEIWDMTGDKVTKTFEEARQIAVSKDGLNGRTKVHGMGLQEQGNTVLIQWVR
ncbi:MAG: hypothetical protein JSS66_06875 [Armatimonadetes bacterium]|nr:hypothetical protein [Armatimonadota bacterium]